MVFLPNGGRGLSIIIWKFVSIKKCPTLSPKLSFTNPMLYWSSCNLTILSDVNKEKCLFLFLSYFCCINGKSLSLTPALKVIKFCNEKNILHNLMLLVENNNWRDTQNYVNCCFTKLFVFAKLQSDSKS